METNETKMNEEVIDETTGEETLSEVGAYAAVGAGIGLLMLAGVGAYKLVSGPVRRHAHRMAHRWNAKRCSKKGEPIVADFVDCEDMEPSESNSKEEAK